MRRTVCMIVQQRDVKGGIAAVVNGYYGSRLEEDHRVIYIESYRDGSKTQKLIKAVKAYFAFSKTLKREKPDLIHMHTSFGPSFYRSVPFILMSDRARIPVIDHIHGSEFDKFYTDAGGLKKRIVERVWKRCAAFIVLSDEWKRRFGVVIPSEKLHVVENYGVPVSEERLKAAERRGCQILFLGAINRMKGCYDMVDVMARLKEKLPGVRLIMAGDGEMDGVLNYAAERGVDGVIEFPGWVRGEEKERLLCSSDIFFLPSYTEGMPMSILDAMGAGLPIVASDVGGIPKLVKDGVNGFLRKAGDCGGFADAIEKLLADGDTRRAFGSAGRECIKREFSLDRHIDAIESVYDSVLNSSYV